MCWLKCTYAIIAHRPELFAFAVVHTANLSHMNRIVLCDSAWDDHCSVWEDHQSLHRLWPLVNSLKHEAKFCSLCGKSTIYSDTINTAGEH